MKALRLISSCFIVLAVSLGVQSAISGCLKPKTVDGKELCEECSTGLFLSKAQDICASCPAGCFRCDNFGVCVECAQNSYLVEQTKLCAPCPFGCKLCFGSNCNACITGFGLDSAGACYRCADNCEFCSKGAICDRCRSPCKLTSENGNQYCDCNSFAAWYHLFWIGPLSLFAFCMCIACCAGLQRNNNSQGQRRRYDSFN